MTKTKKIECLTKLLTWYEDAYAHCEGAGMWDMETLYNFYVHSGMCFASSIVNDTYLIKDFIKLPSKEVAHSYWFDEPVSFSTDEYNRQCLTLRINYMRQQLKKLTNKN